VIRSSPRRANLSVTKLAASCAHSAAASAPTTRANKPCQGIAGTALAARIRTREACANPPAAAPNENAAKGPGQWNVYDITLIGRRVTVVLNGHTIIGDQIIPGITGGGLDSDEGAPGPILLQGDHLPIEYRNIHLTPAK